MRRIYHWPVILLAVLNLILIGFILFDRGNAHSKPIPPASEPRPHTPAHILLKLSPEQDETFRILSDEHHSAIRTLNEQQTVLVQTFVEAQLNSPEEIHNELLDKILAIEREKTLALTKHFAAVKKILTPSQMPYFQEFTKNVFNKKPRNRKNPPPPRRN